MFHKHKDGKKGEEDPKETIENLNKKIESLKKENSEQAMLMQDTIIQKDKQLKDNKIEIKELKEKLQNLPTQEALDELKGKIKLLEEEKEI